VVPERTDCRELREHVGLTVKIAPAKAPREAKADQDWTERQDRRVIAVYPEAQGTMVCQEKMGFQAKRAETELMDRKETPVVPVCQD